MTWHKQTILHERMRRQRLLEPIEHPMYKEEYLQLFRLLQPVSPIYFTRPGDPPKLVHRTRFDDYDLSSELRSRQQYVKGRFWGGRVGYVLSEDLRTYAIAFRKPIAKPKDIHEDVFQYIRESGGCSKEMIKAELNYPAGQIAKALQDLQCAFLVYENQIDTDWDTGWFDFASEWFALHPTSEEVQEARIKVLENFVRAMVFATEGQMRSWSQWPRKTVQSVIYHMRELGMIERINVQKLGEGYMLTEDIRSKFVDQSMPTTSFMLDRSDLLVRAHMDELKERYKDYEVLQYLLIDGQFQGSVIGHWRIGPHEIEDVIVELNDEQASARKDEILDAVRAFYSPATHPILNYNGKPI